jgi:hypothetical protein
MSNRIYKPALLMQVFSISILLAACNLPGNGVEPVEPIQSPPPTSPPEDGGSDACLLQFPWFMSTGNLDLLVGTLIPVPNVTVSQGNLAILFRPSGTFSYQGSPHIRIDLGEGQYIEGHGNFTNEGTYTTSDGIITFSEQASESTILRWQAYANGQVIEMSGQEAPSFSILPSGPAPYRCSPGALEIDTRSPGGSTVTMFFD